SVKRRKYPAEHLRKRTIPFARREGCAVARSMTAVESKHRILEMIIIHVGEDHIVEASRLLCANHRCAECTITIAKRDVPVLLGDVRISAAVDDHEIGDAVAVEIAGADILQAALSNGQR